jgi:hypothetical protein
MLFLAFSCLFSSPMKAQTIRIDSTFTSDGEIFPFSPNDTIYGLSISGSVALHSDTSLVRVILTDIYGQDWMVYEAYPMIVTDTAFEIVEECDETCFLEKTVPFSLTIQIIGAEINISTLFFEVDPVESLSLLQYEAKRNKDFEKTEQMNHFIQSHSLTWTAGDNELLAQYYQSKKKYFGYDKYSTLGFDYHISGVFQFLSSRDIITNSGTMITEFDWREKHDANSPGSNYYSPEGWLTPHRGQGNDCSSCWVFGPIASVEAVTNLLFNMHCDYDLAEKDVLCCAEDDSGDGCDGGNPKYAMNFLHETGTFNEENYPYWDENEPHWYSGCCEQDMHNPEYNLKCGPYKLLHNTAYESIDTIKARLIETGPLVTWIDNGEMQHCMSLIGYYTAENNFIRFIFKDSRLNPYYEMSLDWDDLELMSTISGPIIITEGPVPELAIDDKDQDGYYNWGIGPIPEDWGPPCHTEVIFEDWNDNQNRIGPCDENFIEQSIMPEMKLEISKQTQSSREFIEINNGEVIFFDQSDLSIDNNILLKVVNNGDAQLNFQKISLPIPPHARVDIDYQNHSGLFEYHEDDFLDTAICMHNEDTFIIKLKSGAQSGDLAHIHIYVDEPDIDDFEFTLIYNSCETISGYDEINREIPWPNPYYTQLRDLHIINGGILTISGTVFLSPEVDIIVERGGKLIIDGGKLTGTCGNLWNGIDVWGNASMPQEQTYQGIVEVLNGGIIEFADTAISTYKIDGSSLVYTGGIVNAIDAVFNNNYVGICLAPYSNPIGGGNKSAFKRSQFIITDEYYQSGNVVRTSPKCGLQMSWVNGINFEGCSFINNSTAEKRKRGCGIVNMDADFHVKNACLEDNQTGCEPTVPCRFEGLDYGIKSLNVWSFRRMSVESAEFIDNFRSIYLSMNLDSRIINNRFELNTDDEYFSPGDTLVGIYTDVCSRYQMEHNEFVGADPDHFELVGMHILNSGEDYNEVYNNYFENLDYGVIAAGRNKNKDGSSGLCIKCNDFTKCGIDVFVTPGGYDPKLSGIATNQGEKNIYPAHEPDLAAGNTFSDLIDDENNYWNDKSLTMLQYVHHNTESTDENVLPAYYTNIHPDQDDDAAYSKDRSCPSILEREGLILSEEKSKYYLENAAVDILQDSLNVFIDGGNTPGINFEILTSFPDDALQLHQELLDISPYLSDTILKSAIEHENVLLNAMVRDVLVANPQAAKEPSIMAKLDERMDPFPDYMKDEIAAGLQYYGAKELAMQNLASHKQKMAKSLSNLTWLLKQDTTASLVTDSLIALFESIEQINAKYESAFLYLSKKDTVSAISILNVISQQFDLDAPLQNEHELYLELFDLVPVLLADSCVIDSALIQRLFDVTNYEGSLPGIYSRNLLETKNLLFYDEPVYLANISTKGYSIISSNKDHEDAKSPYMEIFPNPTKTFFIIKYDLREFNSPGTILISDQVGKILKTIPIDDRQNQKIVETNTLCSGIYLVSLYVNDKLKAKAKLIIR